VSTAAAGIRPAYSPHTWVYVTAAVAMIAVVVEHLRSHLGATQHGMADMPGMAATRDIPEMHHVTTSLAVSWGWWVAMTAAMMLPVAAANVERIAAASLWRRRHVAPVEYVAGYLGVWSLYGLTVIWVVATVWPAGVPALAPAIALVVAAVWQVTPVRKRALRSCARPAYVNVRGWRADRDCVLGGVAHGRRCVLTCAAAMAVMALAHSMILMLLLTGLLLTERAPGPNPARRPGRPQEAIALAVLAVGVGAWAGLGRGDLP
jgi:predicted metal-binding membrane protein